MIANEHIIQRTALVCVQDTHINQGGLTPRWVEREVAHAHRPCTSSFPRGALGSLLLLRQRLQLRAHNLRTTYVSASCMQAGRQACNRVVRAHVPRAICLSASASARVLMRVQVSSACRVRPDPGHGLYLSSIGGSICLTVCASSATHIMRSATGQAA